MSYAAVIGAGSWGTTLAIMLGEKGYDTALWVLEKDLAAEMDRTRMNGRYLPGVPIPQGIKISSDMAEVLKNARCVISVVPAQHTRAVFTGVALPKDALIVTASKGIEQGTSMTMSAVLWEATGKGVSVLSGPSFALEVARKKPTAVTLASPDGADALLLQEMFTTNYFRVYTHHDVLGVELAGALKNVMAIAAGISDGLGLGYNARAALITRGLAEMTRLGTAMGAKEHTFSGLSGLGDLVLTCTGPLSRNYTVGQNLAKGMKTDEILASTRSVAEGVHTAKAALELSRSKGVEMPIVEQVHAVLYGGKDPADAVNELMTRALKSEFQR